MSATAEPVPPTLESFGLPECTPHLIAKLRNMPPERLAKIRDREYPEAPAACAHPDALACDGCPPEHLQRHIERLDIQKADQ